MRLRSLALPPEGGGWGLLLEPILIGLIAAPSRTGVLLAAMVAAAFLARQPLKIVMAELAARRRVPPTTPAAWFAAACVAAGIGAGAWAVARAGPAVVMPFAWAAPLALVPVAYDARNRSGEMLPELCGAAALASSAAAIAIAEGYHVRFAMALWAVAAARTLPAIVTVRTRVLKLHGGAASSTPPLVAHASAMGLIFWLQTQGLVARGVLTLLSVLAARAGFTLRASAPRVRAHRIGIEELIAGLLAASLLGALGRR